MDLNKTCGEECKAQLDAEFGEGKCIFISCDVTNGDALRGNAKDRVQLYCSLLYEGFCNLRITSPVNICCLMCYLNEEVRKKGKNKEPRTEERLLGQFCKHFPGETRCHFSLVTKKALVTWLV